MPNSIENDQVVQKRTGKKSPTKKIRQVVFSIEHMIDVPKAHVPSESEIFQK